ncbi:MAG: zf-TFIIB domain-containing protein [Gemmatimonadaceae bacterium]|nr:zf-TFIIB domain-containing protein [Gemmatimonadaceae bacterium]
MDDLKPSRNEEEYFARMDADLRRELRAKADAGRAEQASAARNKCPRCAVTMSEKRFESVTIDQCPQCEGIWLDKSELEILLHGEHEHKGFLGSLLGLVR